MKLRLLLLAGEDDLGEHGLVELDEARAGREQEVDLLAQHAHDVRGQVLARAIRAVGDALHPHRAREEIRAGQGDLHRPVGERAREGELVNRQRPAPAEAPEHGGMAHLGGGHVERSQLGLEHLGIVDQGQQVGERDELAVVEAAAHEARVVVAPLLAVGDDVDARPELGLHGEARRVLGRRLELRVGEPPFHVRVDGLPHPARARPAPHAHDRERRNRRRRGGRGQGGGNADGDRAALGHEARAAAPRARPARRAGPCRRESSAPARAGRARPVRSRSCGTRRGSPPPPRSPWSETRGAGRARADRCAGGSAGAGHCRSRARPRRSSRRLQACRSTASTGIAPSARRRTG